MQVRGAGLAVSINVMLTLAHIPACAAYRNSSRERWRENGKCVNPSFGNDG